MIKNNYIKYILLLLFLVLGKSHLIAQKTDTLISQPISDSTALLKAYPERPKINFSQLSDTVTISFLKYKTEVEENLNFFNLVTIRNHFNQEVSIESEFIIPEGWNFFGPTAKGYRIPANDSIVIPIRFGVSKNVIGGGAYPIQLILNIDDKKYQSSFFIYKTEKSEFEFSVDKRMLLVDAITKTSEFKINLRNKGNVNEYIKLNFKIGKLIKVIGMGEDSDFVYVPLPAGKDTSISYKIWYRELNARKSNLSNLTSQSSIIVSAVSKEKLLQASIWCKYIPNMYERDFYSITSPLVIGLAVNGLLSESRSMLRLNVSGATNLKNNDNINYFLSTFNGSFGGGNSLPAGDFFRRNLVFNVGYIHKRLSLNFGDRSAIRGLPIVGRGIKGIYSFNRKTVLTAGIMQGRFNNSFGGGVHLKSKIGSLPSFGLYGNFLENDVTKSSLRRVGFNSSIPLKKISLGFGVNYNDNTYSADSPFGQQSISNIGYNFSSGYSNKRFNINAGYSYAPFFNLNGAENRNLSLNSNYKFANTDKLTLTLNGQNVFSGDATDQTSFYNNTVFYRGRLLYSTRLKSRIPITFGPEVQYNIRTNNLVSLGNERSFIGTNYQFTTMASFKISSMKSINLFFIPGYSFAEVNNDYYLIDSVTNISSNGIFNYNLGVTYSNSDIFRLSVGYFYGPFFYYNQIDATNNSNINKNLRISPVFTKTYDFGNYEFSLSSLNSFILSISNRSERISLGLNANLKTDNGWNFGAFTNSYISSRQDEESNRTSYRSYSLNLAVNKSFLFERKSQKFVNLTVICFEDVNGNRTREENEPFISNVLIKVKRNPNSQQGYDRGFQEKELLTNINGIIQYNRISSGSYILDINPLINLGDIFPVNGYTQAIDIQNNTTIYVPFVETYKVNGEIKVVYEKFSNDEKIDVGGVRVTAKSESGDVFYALTDNSGSFVISIPSSGYYTVSLNDIFNDDFLLQNNDILVDFNGYKEFEVNFILKQKPRTLNMNGSGYQFKFNGNKKDVEGSKEEKTPNTKPPTSSSESSIDKEAEKKLWEKTDDLQKQIDELRKLKEELQDIQTQQKESLEDINEAKEELEKVKEETQKVQEQQKAQTPATQPEPNQPINSDNSNLDELDDLIDQLIEKTNPTVNYRVEFGVFKEKMPINFLNQLIKFGNVEVSDGEGGESRFISKPYYSKKEAEDYANYLKQQNIGDIRLVGEKDGKEVSVEEVDQLLNR